MTGWISTAVLIIAFFAISSVLVFKATNSRWQCLIVFGLAGALVVPVYPLTGDVSALMPDLWSDGPDGKDQIILVSIAATFLWPVIAAALIVWAARSAICR